MIYRLARYLLLMKQYSRCEQLELKELNTRKRMQLQGNVVQGVNYVLRPRVKQILLTERSAHSSKYQGGLLEYRSHSIESVCY